MEFLLLFLLVCYLCARGKVGCGFAMFFSLLLMFCCA